MGKKEIKEQGSNGRPEGEEPRNRKRINQITKTINSHKFKNKIFMYSQKMKNLILRIFLNKILSCLFHN